MRLVFRQKNDYGATEDGFEVVVSKKEKRNFNKEKILEKFISDSDVEKQILEYFELFRQEKLIAKKRSELLNTLKKSFQEKSKIFEEKYPEYYL